MALRNALDRLRNATTTQSSPLSKKSQGNGPTVRLNGSGHGVAPSTASSVFSLGVDVTERDVFDFSDDEFLQDGIMDTVFTPSTISEDTAPRIHTGPCSIGGEVGASSKEVKDSSSGDGDSLDKAKDGGSKTISQNEMQSKMVGAGSKVVIDMEMSPLGSQVSPIVAKPVHSPRVYSPSSSSLEKLKSFKFVKTLNKNGARKPELESGVLPPAKRRSVCDDVTNTSSQSSSPQHISDEISQDIPLPIHLELDFDDFLSDLEDTDIDCTSHTSSNTPKETSVVYPSPFKQPSYNPRRSTTRMATTPVTGPLNMQTITSGTPSRTLNRTTVYSSISHPRNTSVTLTPSTPTHTPISTRIATTPVTGPLNMQTNTSGTPSKTLNRTTVYSSTSHPSVTLTPCTPTSEFRTPQRAPIKSHSTPTVNPTSGGMFATPKNRPLRTITTPSSSLRTPSFAQFPARRKFPGPAGFLPALAPGQSLDSITVPHPSTPAPASTPRIQDHFPLQRLTAAPPDCSQSSSDPQDFTQGPWVEMMEDLDMNDVNSSALLAYNISRTVNLSSRQKLLKGKVTHLRVMLKSIVQAGKTASAVLKDPTGEILCTLDAKVLEEYHKELQPGAVLILRQVSVFSPMPGKHYLSITPDNIVRIYSSSHSTSSPRRPLLLLELENDSMDTSSQDNQLLPDTSQQPSQDRSVLNSALSSRNVKEHHRDGSSSGVESGGYEQSRSSNDNLLKETSQDIFDQERDNFIKEAEHHRIDENQMRQSSVFSQQLCEDEFDDLFSDFEDSSLDF